jgi:hypothetical protein
MTPNIADQICEMGSNFLKAKIVNGEARAREQNWAKKTLLFYMSRHRHAGVRSTSPRQMRQVVSRATLAR